MKGLQTILGINGVIGEGLAHELIQRGYPVRGVSRGGFTGAWEHRSADALNKSQLLEAVKGSEVVYVCLGLVYNIKVWQRDWPIVMGNVIEVCLETGAKLVFLDNVYMYGKVDGVMTEETPNHPSSEKGKVRAVIADMLMEAIEKKGLKGCIARAADFYGPKNNHSVLNDTVFVPFSKGKKANWLGRDDVKHAYTYTEDIFKALATLGLDERANGQIWHLPTDFNALTGKELIEMIAKEMEVLPRYQKIGNFMLRLLGLFMPIMREMPEMMYQYNSEYIFDSSKYDTVFGDMKATSYEEGIRKTAQFYLRMKDEGRRTKDEG